MDLQLDDTTLDLVISGGDLVLVDGSNAVAQHLMQRLRSFRGEWFLDLTAGVPYFQDILVKSPNPMAVDTALKMTIMQTPGITELTAFELTFDRPSRTMNLNFSCETIDGPLDFTGIQIG